MLIRKGDVVEVISGDDAGTSKARTTGKVLRVMPKTNKIVVEGINKVYKHLKPGRNNQQGGRLSKEMPIDVSNVMLFCAQCSRGVRIARKIDGQGRKFRTCKKCGSQMGQIGH